MVLRVCRTCGIEKVMEDFYPNKESAMGRRLSCKKCHNDKLKAGIIKSGKKDEKKEYMKAYRLRNLEKWKRTPEQQKKVNAARVERYKNDPDFRASVRSKVSDYFKSNPHVRKRQRMKKYNLTLADFDAMLKAQDGKCAICGYSDTSRVKFFPLVDHCHNKGHVRGILCSACNFGIGKFKDNPELLIKAAQYLIERVSICGNG